MHLQSVTSSCAALLAMALLGADAAAEEEPLDVDIIKATQNPLTRDLGGIAFENTFNFGLGQADEFGYSLLVKLSLPVILSKRFGLINQSVLPVVVQPSLVPGGASTSGVGDLQHTVLLSATTPRRVTWGLGLSAGFPTATNDLLGGGKWLLGPAAIFVITPRRAVLGMAVKNLWSVGGDSKRAKVSKFLLRPQVIINLDWGWFITSKPIITANWQAQRGERWFVPVGGGVGKVFRIGRFGLSLEFQAFGYPVRPDTAPTWSVGLEGKVLFRRGQIRESIRERRNLAAVLRSSPVPGANEAEQGIADFGNTLLRVGFDSQAVSP